MTRRPIALLLSLVLIVVAILTLGMERPTPIFAQQQAASPVAEWQERPIIPGQQGKISVKSPNCIDCYFGLWSTSIPANASVTLLPLEGKLGLFASSASIEEAEPLPGDAIGYRIGNAAPNAQMRAWPSGTPVTIENPGAAAVTVFLTGIIDGRPDLVDPAFSLIGGAAFRTTVRHQIAIGIAAYTVTPGSVITFGPDFWPTVVFTPGGIDRREIAAGSIDPFQVVDVNSYDEFGSTATVIDSGRGAQLTLSDPGTESVVFWVAGVTGLDVGPDEGCGIRCVVGHV